GPLGRLWRRSQQRYGEPGVAEGERRLGCLEYPLVRRGADHPPDPRWHRGAGPARPEGHRDRAPGRARRARGRPESAVGRQEPKDMGGETSAGGRNVLDDLVKRGLRKPEFLIVDSAPVWSKPWPPCGATC